MMMMMMMMMMMTTMTTAIAHVNGEYHDDSCGDNDDGGSYSLA